MQSCIDLNSLPKNKRIPGIFIIYIQGPNISKLSSEVFTYWSSLAMNFSQKCHLPDTCRDQQIMCSIFRSFSYQNLRGGERIHVNSTCDNKKSLYREPNSIRIITQHTKIIHFRCFFCNINNIYQIKLSSFWSMQA